MYETVHSEERFVKTKLNCRVTDWLLTSSFPVSCDCRDVTIYF